MGVVGLEVILIAAITDSNSPRFDRDSAGKSSLFTRISSTRGASSSTNFDFSNKACDIDIGSEKSMSLLPKPPNKSKPGISEGSKPFELLSPCLLG